MVDAEDVQLVECAAETGVARVNHTQGLRHLQA